MQYPYISTISGKHYALWAEGGLTQETSPVCINDIAHHLAHINRFTGATQRSYTVSEHSLLCESMADAQGLSPKWRMAALLHDAHEAYLGDVATPIKKMLRAIQFENNTSYVSINDFPAVHPWDMLEDAHAAHVRAHFGLSGSSFLSCDSQVIKHIDLAALAHEKATIGPRDWQDWECIEGIPLQERWLSILQRQDSWNRRMLITAFLDRFWWLQGQIADQNQKARQQAMANATGIEKLRPNSKQSAFTNRSLGSQDC